MRNLDDSGPYCTKHWSELSACRECVEEKSAARIAFLEPAVKAAVEMRDAARDWTPLDHPIDNFPNQAGKYLAKKIAAFDALYAETK
jgi:hypothetical protein